MYRSNYGRNLKTPYDYKKAESDALSKSAPQKEPECSCVNEEPLNKLPQKSSVFQGGPLDFLKNLAMDDIILIAIIFMLMSDDDSDKTLLAILAFLFISGF